MSKKAKKIGLIIIVLLTLVGVGFMIFPFVVGMNYGYDAALIENSIKDNCNCKIVEIDRYHSTSEKFNKNVSTSKFEKHYKLILKDCDYNSLEKLEQDVLKSLNEKGLCSEKTIELTVDYSDEKRAVVISDCIIKE